MLLDERVQVEANCPRRWRIGFLGLALSLALSLSVLTLRPLPLAAAEGAGPVSQDAEGEHAPGKQTSEHLPRYRFQPDQRYVYEIKIEADLPGEKQSLAMEYTMTVHQENVEVRVPTTVSARLLTKAEAEELARKQAERQEARKAAAAEAAKPRAISETALNAAIADLKSDKSFVPGAAAKALEAIKSRIKHT